MIKRRKFITTTLKASAIIPLAGSGLISCSTKDKAVDNTHQKKLSILILGGTSFLGPHQIAYALKRGHKVTTFTRGKTKPTVYAQLLDDVEMLIGDREDNLEALKNREWDIVLDNSGRKVAWTEATAELLKDNVGLYLYTSSTGVYYPYLGDNFTEESRVALAMPDSMENENMQYEYAYGVMKANSELAAKAAFGTDRTIIVRPTYMMGPADKTDRFIHWPIRLSRGGEILVPGKKQDPVEYIDVRDVAEWMIRLAETKTTGTFNAVGPEHRTTMEDFIQEASTSFQKPVDLVWIEDYEFLKEHGLFYLVPWIMPTGNNAGSALASNTLAKLNGLSYRPLTKSIRDVYDWWYSDALTPERRSEYEDNPKTVLFREEAILEAWKASKVLS
jgi:2'-hydroxyisoflavone reductase